MKQRIPDAATLRAMLSTMWTIRAFEEKVSELYATGELRGLLHLSIGQEATAVGVCSLLRADDGLFTGHRPHGHFIAKGADLGRLMAELAGRDGGYCRGKGGSMHLVALEKGCLGATGIVGGSLPLALGAALALFEAGTVLILRSHYTMDVFTGALAALYVDRMVNGPLAPPRQSR